MNNWTNDEIKILKDNYLTMTNEQLSLLLKNRTIEAIKTKKRLLGLNTKISKHNFQEVVDIFNDLDYELISTEEDYVDSSKKTIKYICPRHKDIGILTISLGHLIQGQGCPECGKQKSGLSRRKDLSSCADEYKKLCESHGFIYCDVIRDKKKIKIQFYCLKHIELGIQEMTPYNMKRDIKGCKYCSGKQLPEWYVMEKASEINPNIKILEPYKNLTTRMNCVCIKHNKNTSKTMQEILRGQGCYECGLEKLSEKSYCNITEVQERISQNNPHIKLITYNGITEYANCYCEKHDEKFKKYPASMVNKKSGCSQCYAENLRETQGMGIDEFKRRLKNVHPDIEVVGEYVKNNIPIDLYCKKHDYYFSLSPVAILERLSCCEKSMITYKEENMCSLLESWDYKITRQKIFEDCKDKRHLQFDAYLDDYNIAIEYDGEQHFYPVSFGQQSKDDVIERYRYTIKHDKIKEKYCREHNIPLIRIPYWEFENMDRYLFDKLVNYNVIKED